MARVVLMTDFSEAYARRLLLGISKYAHDVGEAWSLARLPSTVLESFGIQKATEYARKLKADAIIGQFRSKAEMEEFSKLGIISIAQDFRTRFDGFPNIVGNHYLAGKMGAEYFIEKGFKHFAFFGPRDMIFSSERFTGFKDAVRKTSREYDIFSLRPSDCPVWEYDLEELSSWLLYLPKPVAIMAADDNWAYFITEACHLTKTEYSSANLRIPEDIALLGVDNDETICNLSLPHLSSIDQNVEEGGYLVAKNIREKLKDENYKIGNIMVMPTRIITRHSSDVFVNDDKNIAKVLKYINNNLTSKILVQDIVAQVPLSRRLLEIRFREKIGTSIYDFVSRARVERMCNLLLQGSSITEAAYELGYGDAKNVSRVFKKVKGMTPHDFINENQRPIAGDAE